MKKRKHSLTLIEVVIALALTGLILSYLWQSFFNAQKQQTLLGYWKEETLKKLYFQEKMSSYFTSLENKGPVFTVDAKEAPEILLGLHTFHPIDPDPDFSGSYPCLLHLSEDKKLFLIHLGKNKKTKEELLLSDVHHLEILFFDPDARIWKRTWDQKEATIPCMIKFIVETKIKEEYVFFPSQYIQPISYPTKTAS